MNSQGTGRLLLILGIGVFLVNIPVIVHGFIDVGDPDSVTANPIVQRGLTGTSLAWSWRTTYTGQWKPLTWMSHLLDVTLFGLNARGHHFTSLLLHVVNVGALFWALQRLSKETWRPFVVAGLFGVHPLHVEAVAWVAQRSYLLSTFFGLLALIAYSRQAEAPGVGRYLVVVVLFVLGLLCGPMLLPLPVVLLLLDYWPLQRWQSTSWSRLLLEKVPLLLLSIAVGVVALIAHPNNLFSGAAPSLGERLGGILIGCALGVRKLVWPVDLTIYAPLGWNLLYGMLSVGILLTITALVLVLRRRYPAVLVGWLWYLVTLLSLLLVVPLWGMLVADRALYFPLIGIYIAITWLLPSPEPEPGPVALRGVVAGSILLVICAVLSWLQFAHWGSGVVVWEQAVACNPKSSLAHYRLGVALYREGEVDRAVEQLKQATDQSPTVPSAFLDLGTIYLRKGEKKQALIQFRKAAHKQADNARVRATLGRALLLAGKDEEAIEQLRKARDLAPDNPDHTFDLAAALAQAGQQEQAEKLYHEGLDADPDWPTAARRQAEELLAEGPVGVRSPEEALLRARQANVTTKEQDPSILETLAMALEANQQDAEALEVARQAHQRALAKKQKGLARQIHQRVRRLEKEVEGRKP